MAKEVLAVRIWGKTAVGRHCPEIADVGLHTSKLGSAQSVALLPHAHNPPTYANHPTKKTPPETSSVAPSLEGDSNPRPLHYE